MPVCCSFPKPGFTPVIPWIQPCHTMDPALPYPGSGPAILWITARPSNNGQLTTSRTPFEAKFQGAKGR